MLTLGPSPALGGRGRGQGSRRRLAEEVLQNEPRGGGLGAHLFRRKDKRPRPLSTRGGRAEAREPLDVCGVSGRPAARTQSEETDAQTARRVRRCRGGIEEEDSAPPLEEDAAAASPRRTRLAVHQSINQTKKQTNSNTTPSLDSSSLSRSFTKIDRQAFKRKPSNLLNALASPRKGTQSRTLVFPPFSAAARRR